MKRGVIIGVFCGVFLLAMTATATAMAATTPAMTTPVTATTSPTTAVTLAKNLSPESTLTSYDISSPRLDKPEWYTWQIEREKAKTTAVRHEI